MLQKITVLTKYIVIFRFDYSMFFLNRIEQIIFHEKCNLLLLVDELNEFYIEFPLMVLKSAAGSKGLKKKN